MTLPLKPREQRANLLIPVPGWPSKPEAPLAKGRTALGLSTCQSAKCRLFVQAPNWYRQVQVAAVQETNQGTHPVQLPSLSLIRRKGPWASFNLY